MVKIHSDEITEEKKIIPGQKIYKSEVIREYFFFIFKLFNIINIKDPWSDHRIVENNETTNASRPAILAQNPYKAMVIGLLDEPHNFKKSLKLSILDTSIDSL